MTILSLTNPEENAERVVALMERPANKETFTLLDGTIQHGLVLYETGGAVLCVSLAIMEQRWEDWPVEIREGWEFKFNQYIKKRFAGYDITTVDNWIRAGRPFIHGIPTWLPDEVQLFDRDGKPMEERVTPTVARLGTSKMIFSAAAWMDGRLERCPKAVGMLFNPAVGPHPVNNVLQGRKPNQGHIPDNPGLCFFIEGNQLWIQRGDNANWFMEINEEGYKVDALVQEAVKYVLAALQIKGKLHV